MNPMTHGAAAGGIKWLVGSRHALMAKPSTRSFAYSVKLTPEERARNAHGHKLVEENSVQVRPRQYIEPKYTSWTIRSEHQCVIETFLDENTFRDLRKAKSSSLRRRSRRHIP